MKNNFSRRDILKMAALGSLYSALCPSKVFAYDNEQTILHATHFGPINAVVKMVRLSKLLCTQRSNLIQIWPEVWPTMLMPLIG